MTHNEQYIDRYLNSGFNHSNSKSKQINLNCTFNNLGFDEKKMVNDLLNGQPMMKFDQLNILAYWIFYDKQFKLVSPDISYKRFDTLQKIKKNTNIFSFDKSSIAKFTISSTDPGILVINNQL